MPHSVKPGTRLAGRYHLTGRTAGTRSGPPPAPAVVAAGGTEDGEHVPTVVWHAVDELLDRPVSVRVLRASSPAAATVLEVARVAATLVEPRFLAVYDAGTQDDYAYVVSEWTGAPTLADVLRSHVLGPTESERITAEVAEAMTRAHEAGLAHRCLRPEAVLRSEHGRIRVAGLGVDAVLAGLDPWVTPDAVSDDVRGCGALLYGALAGRWPLPPAPGSLTALPPAPRVAGVACSPRQVRAGVPHDLDELACRALGGPLRRGTTSFRSPAELSAALAARAEETGPLPVTSAEEDPAAAAATDSVPLLASSGESGPVLRTGLVLAGLALAIGIALLVWQIVEVAGRVSAGASAAPAGSEPGASGPPSTSPAADSALVVALPVEQVVDFDPQGDDGSENPDDVAAAADGDPATAWRTSEYYNSPWGGLKDGVGLVLDLGLVRPVDAVRVQLYGGGGSVQLRAAPPTAEELPTSLEDYEVVGSGVPAPGEEDVELLPEEPVTSRYLLVWLTELPQSSEDRWRGGVREVDVLGPEALG